MSIAKCIQSVVLLCALTVMASAQERKPQSLVTDPFTVEHGAVKSEEQFTRLAFVAYPKDAEPLRADNMPPDPCKEGEEEENPEVEEIKERMARLRIQEEIMLGENIPDPFAASERSPDAITPTLVSSFNATQVGSGNPPDNTMAISTSGYIVVSVNSTISIYNTAGTHFSTSSLYSFFNGAGAGVVNDFYDPNVLFDSQSGRFFFVCCVGRQSGQSRVLCAFSKSSDPNAGWNVYYLTGNPLNNSCWFDFPRIAYSTNEVYVTGNLFTNAGSFNQAVIYQIPKAAGNAGNSLNWQYWSNISGTPGSLMPVSASTGSYGPGVYLVSHNSGSGSATKFYNLTNDMSASNEQLQYTSINTASYSVGANASQQGTTEKLDVGDCRMQNGFYKDGILHYVYAAKVNGTYSGIHYHRLTVSSKTIVTKTIFSTGYDLCYPGVAYIGNSSSDKSVLISFQYSASNKYPGVGAFNVDNANAVSSWVTCATGTGFVNQNNPSNQSISRWGDYTGLMLRNGSSPKRIWGAASFGNTSNNYTCKVFQLGFPSLDPADRTNDDNEWVAFQSNLYPNPLQANGTFEWVLEQANEAHTQVMLCDLNGRVVRQLLNQDTPAGLSNYVFTSEGLSAGTYVIRIIKDNHLVHNEKLVLVD